MTDSSLDRSTGSTSPLGALKQRWWLAALLIPLCTLLGVGLAGAQTTTYGAQAKLAVAAENAEAYTIPGFPTAARDLASDYARWVTSNPPSASNAYVTASPIPESAIVLVEGFSTDEKAAVKIADDAAKKLETAVKEAKTNTDPQAAFKVFTDLAPKVAAAQAARDRAQGEYNSAAGAGKSRAAINAKQAAFEKAEAAFQIIYMKQQANGDLYRRLQAQVDGASELKLVQAAKVVGSDRSSRIQKFGVAGFGIGAALALIAATLMGRTGTRTRRSEGAERV